MAFISIYFLFFYFVVYFRELFPILRELPRGAFRFLQPAFKIRNGLHQFRILLFFATPRGFRNRCCMGGGTGSGNLRGRGDGRGSRVQKQVVIRDGSLRWIDLQMPIYLFCISSLVRTWRLRQSPLSKSPSSAQ